MAPLKLNLMIGAAVVACLLFFSLFLFSLPEWAGFTVDSPLIFHQAKAVLGARDLTLEIADEAREISYGLSYRYSLAPAYGMLFIGFNPRTRYALDESRMNFATDVVWFRDNHVVALTTNIQPQPDPLIIDLPAPADAFLELATGQVRVLGIKEGNLLVW